MLGVVTEVAQVVVSGPFITTFVDGTGLVIMVSK